MARIALKILFLLALVTITFKFYAPGNMAGAWTASICVLLLGLSSLKKSVVLDQHQDMPGILPVLTFLLLIAPLCLFHLLPSELHELGISAKAPDNSWREVLATTLTSIFLALYIWIPLLSYYLIDLAFNRFRRSSAVKNA